MYSLSRCTNEFGALDITCAKCRLDVCEEKGMIRKYYSTEMQVSGHTENVMKDLQGNLFSSCSFFDALVPLRRHLCRLPWRRHTLSYAICLGPLHLFLLYRLFLAVHQRKNLQSIWVHFRKQKLQGFQADLWFVLVQKVSRHRNAGTVSRPDRRNFSLNEMQLHSKLKIRLLK